ncbi:MAG: hypothetical protein IK065_03570 [Neisseriaceae bacterium]|nr:hypothetical protein [Neisseriaceae bacterium]
MLSPVKKIITASLIGSLAVSSLSGCVVSNDPAVNAAATAAVVSMIIYSISDGFYYDQNYNRMPRNYSPPQHVKVVKVNNINDYRKTNQKRGKYYQESKNKKYEHVHKPIAYPYEQNKYNNSHYSHEQQRNHKHHY